MNIQDIDGHVSPIYRGCIQDDSCYNHGPRRSPTSTVKPITKAAPFKGELRYASPALPLEALLPSWVILSGVSGAAIIFYSIVQMFLTSEFDFKMSEVAKMMGLTVAELTPFIDELEAIGAAVWVEATDSSGVVKRNLRFTQRVPDDYPGPRSIYDMIDGAVICACGGVL